MGFQPPLSQVPLSRWGNNMAACDYCWLWLLMISMYLYVLGCVWFFVAPWTVVCQARLSLGFSRQEYWRGLPFPTPGDFLKPTSPLCPALAGGFFTTSTTWEAPVVVTYIIIIWNLRKKATLWMAIDLQEEELTFLQKKEAVNKKQLGDIEPHTHTQAKHDLHQSLKVSPDGDGSWTQTYNGCKQVLVWLECDWVMVTLWLPSPYPVLDFSHLKGKAWVPIWLTSCSSGCIGLARTSDSWRPCWFPEGSVILQKVQLHGILWAGHKWARTRSPETPATPMSATVLLSGTLVDTVLGGRGHLQSLQDHHMGSESRTPTTVCGAGVRVSRGLSFLCPLLGAQGILSAWPECQNWALPLGSLSPGVMWQNNVTKWGNQPVLPVFSESAQNSQPTGKDPDAGKDRGQEEKGVTDDEMVGWHHWLNGHEFEQTLGDGEGHGSLGHKESDRTEWLNNSNNNKQVHFHPCEQESRLENF